MADFAQIVRDNQGMVYSLAYHCLRDPAVAEEITQDVFMELHRVLHTLESEAHIRHWLRRVASHRSIDQARRRKLRPMIPLDDTAEPASLPVAGDPMLSGTLQRLVASLPETPRLVVILRYMEDLSPTEIAETLEIPVRTVKSHLQRSLALLRGKLTRVSGEVAI